jgi:hypothetical protein
VCVCAFVRACACLSVSVCSPGDNEFDLSPPAHLNKTRVLVRFRVVRSLLS